MGEKKIKAKALFINKKKGRFLAMLCLFTIGVWAWSGCGSRESVDIRVGSLKGPTSMGILFMMEEKRAGGYSCTFQMAAGADELLPLLVKGDLDIALVPANVAAALYQKTDGGVAAIDVNTLGVLYFVTGSDEIAEVGDLKGKTICLTGKGTTPDAALQYILKQNGLSQEDCVLEYKSEAAEVAAVLAKNPDAVGLLPQPFVASALMQNENLKIVLDMNEEWGRSQKEAANGANVPIETDVAIVTGVTIVRREFLEEHEDAVTAFLDAHRASVEAVLMDVDTGASLCAAAGIVPKEEVARQAIPQCNLVCITGEEMADALGAYLEVLFEFQPQLVGGEVPGEDFYYIPN